MEDGKRRGPAGRDSARQERKSGDMQRNGQRKPPFGGGKTGFRGKAGPAGGDKRPFRGKPSAPGGEAPGQSGEGRPIRNSSGKPADFKRERPADGGRFVRKDGRFPARSGVPAHSWPVPAPGRTDGVPARRLAFDVIQLVTAHGAYASLALDEKLRTSTLSALDRRLAARLVYDTLENLTYLDWVLRQVMAREDTDSKLLNVLRLGACQLLLEDRIPESAATNTSVQLCKELGMEPLAGVCNGILRNLIRDRERLTFPDPETEPVKAMSVKYSIPEWLVKRLTADYGAEQAEKLMAVRGTGAPLLIRRNLLRGGEERFLQLLEKKVWTWEKGPLPGTALIRGVMNLGEDNDFKNGEFSVQSAGSMLACLAVSPGPGQTVLDACAAPGGKSCYMAELMGGTGRVQAWELHEHRVKLIEAQVKRLGLENVRPMARDATMRREALDGTMDAVLLDAPCSGTGDLNDKPDIKLRLKEENLETLVQTQRAILEATAPAVKPGGVLVYATCSVLREENDLQMASFLERHPEFTPEPLPETVPERFRMHWQSPGLQLLPHRDGVGGFYICRMRRRRE